MYTFNTALTALWDVAQLVRASDRHATDAGSIPRCGKGFFSMSQCRLSYGVRTPPCAIAWIYICAHVKKSCSPCQSSVDYGNTKTPSMHPGLGSATLLQLAFPGEGTPNLAWKKSHWDNTVRKQTKKKEYFSHARSVLFLTPAAFESHASNSIVGFRVFAHFAISSKLHKDLHYFADLW